MNRIVQSARGWIGTPYCHQASAKGAGCDCLGLIRGVWREVVGPEPAPLPPYSRDWGEVGAARGEPLLDALCQWLIPATGPPKPGQVAVFRMRTGAVAKHLGILTTHGNAAGFIHAYDRHGVMESPLSPPWQRRMVARFCYPARSTGPPVHGGSFHDI